VVVQQHDLDGDPLLRGGDDLGRHHQVGAVADHHPHVTLRRGQLDPDPARNLVAHAGVAVLQVVAFGIAGAPQLVQVAGQAARRAEHHILRAGKRVEHADHLALAEQRAVLQGVDALYLGVPGGVVLGAAPPVGGTHLPAFEQAEQLFQRRAGVAHQGDGAVLGGVELGHVDIEEAHVRILELGLGGGGEVGVARADADHQVGLAGDDVGPQRPARADRAQAGGVVVGQRALAGLRLPDRDAGRLHEAAQDVRGVAVVDAAAGDDQRLAAGADPPGGAPQQGGVRPVAGDVPDAPPEEGRRVVTGHRLHVLRQGQRHRTGIRRGGQDTHGLRQGGQELLRAGQAIPVTGDRLEAVVDRDVLRMLPFKLLEHGGLEAPGEDVAGQQQHRDAVDGGGRRAGDHVGRAGADRRRAGEGLQAVLHLGVGHGNVHHRLLVAGLVVAEGVRVLLQGLPDAGHVAVAEDAPRPGEEGGFHPVTLDNLVLQERDQRLRHRQTSGGHAVSLPLPRLHAVIHDRQARIDGRPGALDPGVGRIVGGGQRLGRSGQKIEVIRRVAVRADDRVVAFRDEHAVMLAGQHQSVDGAIVVVDALVGVTFGPVDLVEVNLLQVGFQHSAVPVLAVDVVLVRRVA